MNTMHSIMSFLLKCLFTGCKSLPCREQRAVGVPLPLEVSSDTFQNRTVRKRRRAILVHRARSRRAIHAEVSSGTARKT